MTYSKWIEKNTTTLVGKTILITGGTGTLAENASTLLCRLGAKLILTARNSEKAKASVSKIKGIYKDAKIDVLPLELSDTKSIDSFMSLLKTKYPNGVDYFINNAGCFRLPKTKSTLGYDIHFATNFLGPFYLVNSLLNYLNIKLCKIITVTSITYNQVKIDFDDIDKSKSNNYIEIYANSKRFLTLSLFQLKEEIKDKYKNITIDIVHPGVSATNIIHYSHGGYPKWFYKIAISFMKVFFTSPKIASLNLVYPIFFDCCENKLVGPKGPFEIWGYPTANKIKKRKVLEEEKIYDIANNLIEKIKTTA